MQRWSNPVGSLFRHALSSALPWRSGRDRSTCVVRADFSFRVSRGRRRSPACRRRVTAWANRWPERFKRAGQSIDYQPAVRLHALPAQGVPVENLMPPHEARRPARSRNTIDVAVKRVVAVRDYGEVLMARLDVGRASGTGGTLKCHLVVVDFIVARLVYRAAVSPSLVIAALVYQHDPAFARADS